jgi:hypothetical protein
MKIRAIFVVIIIFQISIGCKKKIPRPISKEDIIGTWSSLGTSSAPAVCSGSGLYDPNCIFFNFKIDGTFTTSKSIRTDTKEPLDICSSGNWDIQLEGEYNMKFTFNNKTIFWDMFVNGLNNKKDRLNIFEENCDLFNLIFQKE